MAAKRATKTAKPSETDGARSTTGRTFAEALNPNGRMMANVAAAARRYLHRAGVPAADHEDMLERLFGHLRNKCDSEILSPTAKTVTIVLHELRGLVSNERRADRRRKRREAIASDLPAEPEKAAFRKRGYRKSSIPGSDWDQIVSSKDVRPLPKMSDEQLLAYTKKHECLSIVESWLDLTEEPSGAEWVAIERLSGWVTGMALARSEGKQPKATRVYLDAVRRAYVAAFGHEPEDLPWIEFAHALEFALTRYHQLEFTQVPHGPKQVLAILRSRVLSLDLLDKVDARQIKELLKMTQLGRGGGVQSAGKISVRTAAETWLNLQRKQALLRPLTPAELWGANSGTKAG